jgi:hypothetical protein
MTKPLRFAVLVGVLLMILVVQLLPQVDLPDIAFQRETAPVVVRSRLVPKLVVPVVSTIVLLDIVRNVSVTHHETSNFHSVLLPVFLPILLCSLLC